MEVWVATGNAHKLQEISNMLSSLNAEVHGSNELSVYSSPIENGDSFEANARIKAKSLAAVKNDVWVIADDSGLCCVGLNGIPGIHSARYAGDKATDMENVAKLLKMLQIRTTNRKAYFQCSIVAISPSGEEFVFNGQIHGEISRKQTGTGGFGYDPVFIPEGHEKTMAELSAAEKNKISHRAEAIKQFKEYLSNNL